MGVLIVNCEWLIVNCEVGAWENGRLLASVVGMASGAWLGSKTGSSSQRKTAPEQGGVGGGTQRRRNLALIIDLFQSNLLQ